MGNKTPVRVSRWEYSLAWEYGVVHGPFTVRFTEAVFYWQFFFFFLLLFIVFDCPDSRVVVVVVVFSTR